MESNRLWALVAVLALVQAGLSLAAVRRAREEHTTYVLTPLVDVVPGGAPLGAIEAEALQGGLRNSVEARDMQRGYARLGSTLSLDDLLRGIEAMDAAGVPLQGAAADRVRATLEQARRDHADIVKVQADILATESRLASEVDAVLAKLPPDTRARVERR